MSGIGSVLEPPTALATSPLGHRETG